MNSDWQTVTEKRQMQQSVTFVLPFLALPLTGLSGALIGVLGPPPRAFSCLSALVLLVSLESLRTLRSLLELIGRSLPFAPHLYPHLYTAKHVLVSTLIVHAELQDIAILFVSSSTRRPERVVSHVQHSRS